MSFYSLMTESGLVPNNYFVYDSKDDWVGVFTKSEFFKFANKINERIDMIILTANRSFLPKFLTQNVGSCFYLYKDKYLELYIKYDSNFSYFSIFIKVLVHGIEAKVDDYLHDNDNSFRWYSMLGGVSYTVIPEYYAERLVSDKVTREREIKKILNKTVFVWQDAGGTYNTMMGMGIFKTLGV